MALDSKRRAARLTQLREQARLTQKGLDEKSGVSERTIQRAEDPNDDIELRYSTREKLAKALGVKPEDLLAEAETEKGDTPDVIGSLNGNSAPGDTDELRAQLDRIEQRQTDLAALIEAQAEAMSQQFSARLEELLRELDQRRRRAG
jgi:transcriptional regulator with XRE-family HTH domain